MTATGFNRRHHPTVWRAPASPRISPAPARRLSTRWPSRSASRRAPPRAATAASRRRRFVAIAQDLHADDRRQVLARLLLGALHRFLRRAGRRRDAALADASAPVLTVAAAGMPLLSPLTWMLAAFTTCSAAMLMLPDTRSPPRPRRSCPAAHTGPRRRPAPPRSAPASRCPRRTRRVRRQRHVAERVIDPLGGVYTTVVLAPGRR